jgi:Smg protein
MMDVLVYLYENFGHAEVCLPSEQLSRKLDSVGFPQEEVALALDWLGGLRLAIQDTQRPPDRPSDPSLPRASTPADSMRIYTPLEQTQLGPDCIGFIRFLEQAAGLGTYLREILIDRAMAATDSPVALHDFKIMALMVYWGAGEEPETLVLDELCDDGVGRVAH